MYTINRKTHLTDKLRLVDGSKELVVPVEIDIDKAIANYWRLYEKLYLAQETLKKDPSELNQEQFGNAFLVLLIFIFGDEWAEKILDFYDGNYTEALTDLYPYIGQVIYPQLKKASAQRAAALKRNKRA